MGMQDYQHLVTTPIANNCMKQKNDFSDFKKAAWWVFTKEGKLSCLLIILYMMLLNGRVTTRFKLTSFARSASLRKA